MATPTRFLLSELGKTRSNGKNSGSGGKKKTRNSSPTVLDESFGYRHHDRLGVSVIMKDSFKKKLNMFMDREGREYCYDAVVGVRVAPFCGSSLSLLFLCHLFPFSPLASPSCSQNEGEREKMEKCS